MIFRCVLISFFYVNVSAVYLMDYCNQVDVTNTLIKNTMNKRMDLNQLYGGLHIAIKNIVRGGQFNFEKLNYMVAIPEVTSEASLEVLTELQIYMQDAIINVTGLDRPPANQVLDFKTLGLTRRKLITQVIIDLFTIDLLGENDVSYAPLEKCHMAGMAIQTKYTDDFTTIAYLDYNYCVVIDTRGIILKYSEEERQFWEVDNNGRRKEEGNLLDQLNVMILGDEE